MRTLSLSLILLAACSPGTRVVTIGDYSGASPSFRYSAVGLLADNPDDRFPDFAGKDLRAHFGEEVKIVRLDHGGDSYRELAATPFCTCRGSDCAGHENECLDVESGDDTTLIIHLGANDLFSSIIAFLGDMQLTGASEGAIFRARVKTVLGYTHDSAYFPASPRVLVTNGFDPTDGSGDVGLIARELLPAVLNIDPQVIPSERTLPLLSAFLAVIQEESANVGAELVDTHAAFAGHGYHAGDAMHPSYVAADPTRWISVAFEPSIRGAHEIRRALWNALAKESVTAIPQGVVDIRTDAPEVPANGWATAVVDSKITASLAREGMTCALPNIDADPKGALGAPSPNQDKSTAIGVRGAYGVWDLGALAPLGDGPDLVVVEQGSDTGGVSEAYRVSIALEPAGPFVVVADSRGRHGFELEETGLGGVRYVRIESLVSTTDVLSGVGSATAPGPEIEGIGAVHLMR